MVNMVNCMCVYIERFIFTLVGLNLIILSSLKFVFSLSTELVCSVTHRFFVGSNFGLLMTFFDIESHAPPQNECKVPFLKP